jgi:hypothetical protein
MTCDTKQGCDITGAITGPQVPPPVTAPIAVTGGVGQITPPPVTAARITPRADQDRPNTIVCADISGPCEVCSAECWALVDGHRVHVITCWPLLTQDNPT